MDDRSSSSAELTQASAAPSPTFTPQPVPKNPAIAFLLSLIFPGAGQFYCGKLSRGLWILAIFFLGLEATIYLATHLGDPDGKSIRLLWGGSVLILPEQTSPAVAPEGFFTKQHMRTPIPQPPPRSGSLGIQPPSSARRICWTMRPRRSSVCAFR